MRPPHLAELWGGALEIQQPVPQGEAVRAGKTRAGPKLGCLAFHNPAIAVDRQRVGDARVALERASSILLDLRRHDWGVLLSQHIDDGPPRPRVRSLHLE